MSDFQLTILLMGLTILIMIIALTITYLSGELNISTLSNDDQRKLNKMNTKDLLTALTITLTIFGFYSLINKYGIKGVSAVFTTLLITIIYYVKKYK